MGMFKNKGTDIDYTLLQKKGIIKKTKRTKMPFKITKEGNIDLTSSELSSATPDSTASSGSGMAANPFGFLDNLASASTSTTSSYYKNDSSSSLSSSDSTADISTIRIKIDDFEYKLERLMEKLALIEEKLSNFERKVR